MKAYELVKFHPDVLTIPFSHKKEQSRIFRDVVGLCGVTYISVELINPSGEYLFFSSLNAVNFNVISQHLWPYDGSMSLTFIKNESQFFWKDTFHPIYKHQLYQVKQQAFGFKWALSLVRKLQDFYVVYGFASQAACLSSEGVAFSNELLRLGDYCYRQIRPIYQLYLNHEEAPLLKCFIPYESGEPKNKKMDLTSFQLKLVRTV